MQAKTLVRPGGLLPYVCGLLLGILPGLLPGFALAPGTPEVPEGQGLASPTGWAGLTSAQAQVLDPETLRVRVMIDDKHKDIAVSGLDLTVTDGMTGDRLASGATSVQIRLKDGKLVLDDKLLLTSRLWIASPLIYLTLNKQEYRGPLEVRIDENSNENKTLKSILHLSLESYLLGVVPGEMPSTWPSEALKAQVVVARTYAWMQVERSRNKPWDITSDTRDQVYLGAAAETVPVSMAVSQTQGIVLMKDEKLAQTFYHSTCGGATEVPQNVWPTATADFPSVSCEFCRASTHFNWQAKYSLAELATLIKAEQFVGARVTALEVQQHSDSGRALQVQVTGDAGSAVLDGNTFRKLLGYGRLKSTRFTFSITGDQIVFSGQGFGHGAGMCQWGARGMALDGKKAEEILEHYYPGTTRVRLMKEAGELPTGPGQPLMRMMGGEVSGTIQPTGPATDGAPLQPVVPSIPEGQRP